MYELDDIKEGCNDMSEALEEVFIAEAAKICNVNKVTFNKLVVAFKIRFRMLPNGWRIFNKADVVKVAEKLPKKRQRGLPLVTKSRS